MANIERELKAIMEAEYGEEVRSSIYDAIKAGNDEIVVYGRKEEERSQAEAGRIAAENTRAAAEVLREAAKAAAEAAAEAANEAAEKANEAATGGISKMIVNFEEPEDIELPESGETVDTLFGKMKKWLGNLSSGAGSSLLGHLFSPGRVLASDENGRVTDSNVSVADLANISGTTGNLQEQITQLNGNMQWQPIDTSDWTMIDGYRIGLAEYCPAIKLVHFIAANTTTNGIPNSQTHIIPSPQYQPPDKAFAGLAFSQPIQDHSSAIGLSVIAARNGGFFMNYPYYQMGYHHRMEVWYTI